MKDERAQLIHAFNEIVPKIEEHMRMSNALGLAQEVQQSLLPQSDPSLAGFDIAGASIYCDETGGKQALMGIIRNNHTASARQIVATVTEALERFRDDEVQEDDITLVVIKVNG